MFDERTHSLVLRVYFEDTDAMGVVYHTGYLRFMERGRTEWLREQGIEQDWLLERHGVCFALTDTSVRFVAPARFNDELVVTTRLAAHTRVRFTMRQQVRRAQGELVCSAECRAACLDARTFRPRRIPAGVLG